MRWALGVVWFVGCGSVVGATSDAGVDGNLNASCSSNADCTGGLVCDYPVSDGCGATTRCLAPPGFGACKAMPYCACDGTMVYVCSAGAPKPVAHTGACADATSPDACALACERCDTSAYSPTTQTKPHAASQACSASEVTAFVAACLGSTATPATCAAWQQSDAGACGACAMTQVTSTTWGALVCTSTSCTPNHSGCIDLTLGETSQERSSGGAGSCGDYYSDAEGCGAYVCDACAGNDHSTCLVDASTNGCKTYVDGAVNASACASLDAGATACFPQTDAQYAAFVNVFCGTGP